MIGFLSLTTLTFGQEIYQWVDEKGTSHFTDDLSLVPERYRIQVQKKKVSTEPSPLTHAPVITGEKKEDIPASIPERKDIVGRGEEWWRTKAKEWNEKFLNANKNYETAYAAWKAKEQELQESKFKSKSLQRKLKDEIKVLETKMKEWEIQKEEAKNMLEKVLPKEAADYKADPDWIRIED
jgi:DNA-binding NtrC family response regulator